MCQARKVASLGRVAANLALYPASLAGAPRRLFYQGKKSR